jgi:hypothetical protein
MAQNSIFPDLHPFHGGLSREQESEATTAIRLWCEAACEEAEGDQKASEELKMVDRYVEYLQGIQWPTARPTYRAKPIDNKMFGLFLELLGLLTDIRPIAEITSVSREKADIAQEDALNKRMKAWWVGNNIESTFAMGVVYAILTSSFLKLEWDPRARPMGRGEVCLRPLAPTAVLPLKAGNTLQSAEALIYQDWKPTGWVRAKYPAKAHLVMPDMGVSQYSVDSGPPGNVTPMLFNLLTPAFKRLMTKDKARVGMSAYPECRYREFWLKDYCVAPYTKVLTANMEWKRADELVVGEDLIGCNEDAAQSPKTKAKTGKVVRTRWLRRTKVESIKALRQPCVKVHTDRGTVVCSTLHRWLVKTKQAGNRHGSRWWIHYDWQRAEDLKPGDNIGFVCAPWEEEQSKDAGYLAGIFDGEGWLSKGQLGVAQKPGFVLSKTKALIEERGYKTREYRTNSSAYQVLVNGGREEKMRLLGTIRPRRLLDKSTQLWEGRLLQGAKVPPATVISVEAIGEQEVLGIQTTERTFIAEGFVSHNSVNTSNQEIVMGDATNPWKTAYTVRPKELLYPRGRLIVMAGREIVEDTPNPYWHGMFPFSLLRLNAVPWQLYGMSDCRSWSDLQDIINTILAGVIDMIKKAVNPPFFAPKTAFSEQVWNSLDFSMPGARAAYNAVSPQGPQMFKTGELPGYVLPTLQHITREMNERSGIAAVGEAVRKKQVPGGDTLDQIRMSQQGPIRYKGRNIETCISELGQQMVPNIFQFYNKDERIKVPTPPGSTPEFMDWKGSEMVPSNIQPAEHIKKFEFTVIEGSLLGVQRVEQMMNLMKLRQSREISRTTFFEKLNKLGFISLDAANEEKLLMKEMQEGVGGAPPRGKKAQGGGAGKVM